MNTQSTDLIELFIPTVGICTLFPSIEDLRDNLNTYQSMYEVAKLLDLREIPARSHDDTQEIWRALADTFGEIGPNEVRILISGVHLSYISINTAHEQHKKEPSVTAMDVCVHSAKQLFGTKNPFDKHVEMILDEVGVREEQENNKLFYCLFLSAPK